MCQVCELKKRAQIVPGDEILARVIVHKDTKEKAVEFLIYHELNNYAFSVIVEKKYLKGLKEVIDTALGNKKQQKTSVEPGYF